jgi:phospholipase/lecithinase/hemolysin
LRIKENCRLFAIARRLVGLGAIAALGLAVPSTLLAQSSGLRFVSFGDSLSDVGTYSPFATTLFGGGLFTTNPGQIWTQMVAEHYGDGLTPAFEGGFGSPLVPAGGLGYAQGGSRVSLQPGIGHAPPGSPGADFAQATTVPVSMQVNEFLQTFGRFQSNQVVLINGGANDLLFNLESTLMTGSTPKPAQLLKGIAAVQKAAVDYGALVKKILNAGAKHVVVLNLADFSQSPEGLASLDNGKVLRPIIRAFNDTLVATLILNGSWNRIIYVDAFSFMDSVIENYQALGFTVSNTGTACNGEAEIEEAVGLGFPPDPEFADALFCSPVTYTVPEAPQTYIFADGLHPTTHYSELFAQFVEGKMAARGLQP